MLLLLPHSPAFVRHSDSRGTMELVACAAAIQLLQPNAQQSVQMSLRLKHQSIIFARLKRPKYDLVSKLLATIHKGFECRMTTG